MTSLVMPHAEQVARPVSVVAASSICAPTQRRARGKNTHRQEIVIKLKSEGRHRLPLLVSPLSAPMKTGDVRTTTDGMCQW
jgi:hypothetical protein